jgi:hypothetical protein
MVAIPSAFNGPSTRSPGPSAARRNRNGPARSCRGPAPVTRKLPPSDAFSRHGVRYLFIGKSGAILLGFPDTTQDADLFVERSPENGEALAVALPELGFDLTPQQAQEIRAGKDFVQLKNGPFDLDLVFAPTASRLSRMPGIAGSKWRDFRYATRTTSSPARKQRTA